MMSAGALLPEVIRDELIAMQRQERELTAVRGVGNCLKWTCLAFAVCLLTDAVWNLPALIRGGLLTLLTGWAMWVAWRGLIQPLLRRRSWNELAAAVERDHPELAERLITLVELEAEPNRTSSPVMRTLLAKQTVKAVTALNFSDSLPAGQSLQQAAIGLVALAMLLLPFLVPGQRYALLWGRLIVPFGNHAWGNRVTLHVLDGDRIVVRGSDVKIEAELQGLSAENVAAAKVLLHTSSVDGQSRDYPLNWQADAGRFAVTLPGVDQPISYHIASRWAASPQYHLTVAERPTITTWTTEIEPPPYTGLPVTTLAVAVAELRVPEGSRVRFRWEFAAPVQNGVIDWPKLDRNAAAGPETELNFSADRRSATSEHYALANGPFQVRLTSLLGLESDDPPRRLTLIPDQPPTITVATETIPRSVRPDDVLNIASSATDDYGLAAWEFHWESSTGLKGVLATAGDELTSRTLDRVWIFDLTEHSLAEGQSITLRWRASDHSPAPGPHEVWTDPIVISINSQLDSLESRAVAEAQTALEREVNTLRDAVAAQRKEVDDVHRQTARAAVKSATRPENDELIAQLRQQQAALQKPLDVMREELADRPFLKQPVAEHLPQIEEALTAAETSLAAAGDETEARDQLEHLSRALDELGSVQDQLDKLNQETKSLAALEQELAELARLSRQAEQLADRAETLSQRTPMSKESPTATDEAKPEAADQATLNSLQRETETLADHLEDLLRRRPELLEAARHEERQRLADLAESARELAEQQSQLADAITPQTGDGTASPDAPADATAPQSNAAASPSESTLPMAAEETPSDETSRTDQQQKLAAEAESLADALSESARRLSQSPLDLQEAGQQAAKAAEAMQSAQAAMNSAAESLSQENNAAAGESAQAAEALSQASAESASQTDPAATPQSPASRRIPGAAAGQVAEAAAQLKQAQQQLQNGKSSTSGGPESQTSPESFSDSAPGETSASPHDSAAQLREAARALSVASQSRRTGSPTAGQMRQRGDNDGISTDSDSESAVGEPSQSAEPNEDAAKIGRGGTGTAAESSASAGVLKPRNGSRNWGRLPEHLQSEIRQGATKTPNPEYAPQIKRYFERIAQPARPKGTRP